MMKKLLLIGTLLTVGLGTGAQTTIAAVPAHSGSSPTSVMEQALLQQLQPVITAALQKIYHEQYVQYGCEHIQSINERVTLKKTKDDAYPADAVHGAKYFDIAVSLCRPDGQSVMLLLKNDTPDAHYYLKGYQIR